jgi:hypothetical protein
MLKIMATYQTKMKNKTPNTVLKHELAKKLKLDKLAKGVTGPVLAPFIKKIAAAARKVMGPGKIGCWFDNAKAHRADCVIAELEKHFDRVLFQPPSSPDMNMLDAGVFLHMGRLVQGVGCVTKPEIRAAVKKVLREGGTAVVWVPACVGIWPNARATRGGTGLMRN